MKIIISPKAEKELRDLSKITQIAIAKKIRKLTTSKETQKTEKLTGYKNIYRIRLGNYRIVYKKTFREIYIILINHRREAYRLLKKLFS